MTTRKKPAVGGPAENAARPAAAGPELHAKLRALVGAAELVAIDPIRVFAARSLDGGTDEAMPLPSTLTVDTQFTHRYPKALSKDGTFVLIGLACTFKDADAKVHGETLVELRLAYHFKGLSVPPDEALIDLFAREIAMHHAWPFLRERARSLGVDIGLPPLVLPLRKPAVQ